MISAFNLRACWIFSALPFQQESLTYKEAHATLRYDIRQGLSAGYSILHCNACPTRMKEGLTYQIAAIDGDLCHIGEQVWDSACSAHINDACHAGIRASTGCEQKAAGLYIQALQPFHMPDHRFHEDTASLAA